MRRKENQGSRKIAQGNRGGSAQRLTDSGNLPSRSVTGIVLQYLVRGQDFSFFFCSDRRKKDYPPQTQLQIKSPTTTEAIIVGISSISSVDKNPSSRREGLKRSWSTSHRSAMSCRSSVGKRKGWPVIHFVLGVWFIVYGDG